MAPTTPSAPALPAPTAAVLVHGAGSTPDAALRLLAPLVPAGCRPLALDARADAATVAGRIAEAVEAEERCGGAVGTVAGLSMGAHAIALWAARPGPAAHPLPRLALVMPAWTGAPGAVAAMTAGAADEIERDGVGPMLDRLGSDPATAGDWVVDELVRAWTGEDARAVAAALRAAARSPGPTAEQLALIRAEVAVVGLDDDPLHPVAVAREWAAAIPGAGLRIVGRHEPSHDRGALGRAAAEALTSGSR